MYNNGAMKNKLLAIENILLCVFFLSIFFQGPFRDQNLPFFPLVDFLKGHIVDEISLALPILNLFLAIQFISAKKKKFPFTRWAILTQLSIFWFLFFFVGSFFSSVLWLPLLSVALVVIFFFILKKTSLKIAILNSVTMVLIFILILLFSFEEDYCWNQGTKADPSGIMVIATQQDIEALKGSLNDIKPGDSVGESWRVHMLCHTTFHLADGLKDVYFSPIITLFSQKKGTLALPLSNRDIQTIISQKPRDRIVLYTPMSGDTIALIAKKMSISEETIRWENNLTSNSLKSDKNLRILPVTGVSHLVVIGDTLQSLATKYNTTVQKILDYPFNDYADEQTHTLILGDIIIIPNGIKP